MQTDDPYAINSELKRHLVRNRFVYCQYDGQHAQMRYELEERLVHGDLDGKGETSIRREPAAFVSPSTDRLNLRQTHHVLHGTFMFKEEGLCCFQTLEIGDRVGRIFVSFRRELVHVDCIFSILFTLRNRAPWLHNDRGKDISLYWSVGWESGLLSPPRSFRISKYC